MPRVARHTRLRHDGRNPRSRQCRDTPKNNPPEGAPDSTLTSRSFVRWSMQEIRRIATRLARKRIHPEFVVAWSLSRRAHQADARRANIKSKMQL